jgi:lysophospholipase L1-like esterase
MRLTAHLITSGTLFAWLAFGATGGYLRAADGPLAGTVALLEKGEQSVRIVCIGDSITGVYYHTGGRRAYPEMLEVALKRAYPKAKVEVINAGVSGTTVPHGLERLQRDVLKHKPHLVTIMYGMNDMTRFSLAQFKKNLAEMCTRCREAGAEVLLCTQNSIIAGRSPKTLAEFTQAIHEVGQELKVSVADCHKAYEAVRAKDAREWSLLMSDEIHPNMDGHKMFASVIARVITGKEDTLRDVGPPQPAIPRTLSLLRAGKPIRVLAMPPFDRVIGPALKAVNREARVEVTAWPTEGHSIAQLRQAAKKVRDMKMDLVIVAVPAEVEAETTEAFITSFSWVLNGSLSFAHQQWDVIAVPPSTFQSKLAGKARQREELIRRLIAAQDLSMVKRPSDDARPLQELLASWLREQARPGDGSRR